jgi:hypothetical protein
MENKHIIKITPDLERRVLQERRRGPRERLAELERKLEALRYAALSYYEWNETEYQRNPDRSEMLRKELGLPEGIYFSSAPNQHSEKPKSQPDSGQVDFGGHTEPGQHFTNEPK